MNCFTSATVRQARCSPAPSSSRIPGMMDTIPTCHFLVRRYGHVPPQTVVDEAQSASEMNDGSMAPKSAEHTVVGDENIPSPG